MSMGEAYEDDEVIQPEQEERQAGELPQGILGAVLIFPLDFEVDEHASDGGKIENNQSSDVGQDVLIQALPRRMCRAKKDRL